jgi:guanylate kinase
MVERSYGVILYGPPAVGKDTVTRAMQELDPGYRLFARLKSGGGRTAGYRMVSGAELDEVRRRQDVVWENHRYGSVYVIDRPHLRRQLAECVPVLHVGQPEAVVAVAGAVPATWWTVVNLRCPWEVALSRIVDRRTGDVPDRVRAWHATPSLAGADVDIDTGVTSPSEAASMIHMQVVRVRELSGGAIRPME